MEFQPLVPTHEIPANACAVLCFILADDTPADDKLMTYRYWDWGMTPRRDDYQIAALTLALDKTLAPHGRYQIIRQTETLSRARAHREIARGNFLNVHATPIHPVVTEKDRREQAFSIPINVPLMQGLLGYRSLIIRRSDYEKFSKIKGASELKSLTAGQGRAWTDVNIYRHNGYKVVDDAEYFTLFSMLIAGRFDYLPLSIIEVEDALFQSRQTGDLMILPGLMLYYPLPIFFHVSAKYPELAVRLEQGLILAKQDGSLDKLFEQHFSEYLQQIRSDKMQVLILKNPTVASEMGLDQPLLMRKEKPGD